MHRASRLLLLVPLVACGASSQDAQHPKAEPSAQVASAASPQPGAGKVHCELLPPIKPSPFGNASGARADAQAKFDQGMKELDLQHYDAAASALAKSYETLPHPDVLFDLAVAQCRAGKSDDARSSLKQYEAGNPPDLAAIDKALN